MPEELKCLGDIEELKRNYEKLQKGQEDIEMKVDANIGESYENSKTLFHIKGALFVLVPLIIALMTFALFLANGGG